MKKKTASIEKLWIEIEEIRWQMKVYPNENHIAKSKKLFKLLDQLIDLHNREQNPEKYKLHLIK